MKKLIFALTIWAIISIASPALAEVVREGYCEFFEVGAGGTQTILVVPEGKRFVLLKLYASAYHVNNNWQLTVNNNLFIDGNIGFFEHESSAQSYMGYHHRFVHDFPDKCVVVNAGETLKAENFAQDVHWHKLRMTFIGYFEEEIELTPGPEGPQGPQGEQGPPGITPEEISQLQAQLTTLQQENALLQQQIQAIEQQNAQLQQMVDENRHLLEQLPQLRKQLEELASTVQEETQ